MARSGYSRPLLLKPFMSDSSRICVVALIQLSSSVSRSADSTADSAETSDSEFRKVNNAHLFKNTVPNRVQAHGQTFELGDKHFHVLARPVLLGGELVDGRHDGRSVGALVLCIQDAENSRRVDSDTLNKQKRGQYQAQMS
jgi:hypothetical protein